MPVPDISVLMSVYNGAAYLREAVDSVLQQSYENFEFIIIDDGSTDNSREIIESYSDNRIILIKNGENLGLTASLNKGLKAAKAGLIARIDADDVCLPDRFRKQIDVMRNKPDLTMLGGQGMVYGAGKVIFKYPVDHKKLLQHMIFCNVFAHSTVMFRKQDWYYDEALKTSQDYDLWSRMAISGCVGNLPEPLIKARFHEGQISVARREQQIEDTLEVRKRVLKHFGLETSEEELKIHHLLSSAEPVSCLADLEKMCEWTERLYKDIVCKAGVTEHIIRNNLYSVFLNSDLLGVARWRIYKKSSVLRETGFTEKLRLYVRINTGWGFIRLKLVKFKRELRGLIKKFVIK